MKQVSESIKRFVSFGRRYGWSTAWGYIAMPYMKGRKAFPAKHRAVKDYLWRWSKTIPAEGADRALPVKANVDAPIWVCWLQGEEQMPEVIRLCYQSVRRNAGDRAVVLLTFDNIPEYVDIPAAIERKRNNGEISLTHYADYLRILLLATYGGLWIDASIYVTGKIDFHPVENELYTVKFDDPKGALSPFASQSRWTVSLLGCLPGNSLLIKLEHLMRQYISSHKEFIDFFLFDYLIAMLYDWDPDIKRMIDAIPLNNKDFYRLEEVANKPFHMVEWQEMCDRQMFHKLSWKLKYIETVAEAPTFYGHLLETSK